MKQLRLLLALLLAFSLVAAACGDDEDSSDSGSDSASTDSDSGSDSGSDDDTADAGSEMLTGAGVDAENKVIRVGLNADLSGTFAALTTVIVEGQLVFWERYNDQGGYKGWTVEPVVLDNAYDVPTHLENYDAFSGDGDDSVVMLTNSTGSPHTAAIAEALVEDDLVAIPLSWYSGWTADQTPVVTGIAESGADFVWLTTGPGQTAEIVGGAAAAGFTGQWAGNSPAWNPALLGTGLAEVFDASYTHSTYTTLWGIGDSPGMQDLIATMREYAPDNIADDVYIISWIEGLIAQQVIENAIDNGDITRAGIVASANEITVDLQGLAPNQNWGVEANDAIVRGTYLYDVDLSVFTADGTVSDDDANRGFTLLEGDYVSPTAAAWEYEPCFKAS
jgi:ABC-type branched-subunit amino acid transport system substrate-binding protein